MRKNILVLFGSVLALTTANVYAAVNSLHTRVDTSTVINKIMQHPDGLNRHLLSLGLKAYQWAEDHGRVTKPYLTIVDFSIPSKYRRLWVINLRNDKIVNHTLVANGRNSGLYKGVRFSNRPGSRESSLGIFITGGKFYGDVGLSMRLYGLESGINSNAYNRDVVMHGNWYVSERFAHKYGRVGRSYGCFTLSKTKVGQVVQEIKDGSVLYAYANNQPDAVNF